MTSKNNVNCCTAKIVQLQTERNELRSQIANICDKVATLRHQLETGQRQLQEKDQLLSSIAKQNQSNREIISDAVKHGNAISDEINHLLASKEILENRVTVLYNDMRRLLERVNSFQTNEASKNQKILDLQSELQVLKCKSNDDNQEKSDFKEQIYHLQEELQNEKQKNEKLVESLNEKQALFEQQNNQFIEVVQAKNHIENEYKTLLKNYNAVRDSYHALCDLNAKLQKREVELLANIDHTQDNTKKIYTENMELTKNLEIYEKNCCDLKIQIKTLEKELQEKTTEMSSIKDQLQISKTDSGKTIEQLNEQNKFLTQELNELKTQVAQLNKHLHIQKRQNVKNQIHIDKLDKDLHNKVIENTRLKYTNRSMVRSNDIRDVVSIGSRRTSRASTCSLVFQRRSNALPEREFTYYNINDENHMVNTVVSTTVTSVTDNLKKRKISKEN